MSEVDNVVRIIININNPNGVDFAQLYSYIRHRLLLNNRRPKRNMAEVVSNALAQAVHTKKLIYQSGRYKENIASNTYLLPSPSPTPIRSESNITVIYHRNKQPKRIVSRRTNRGRGTTKTIPKRIPKSKKTNLRRKKQKTKSKTNNK